MTGSCNFKCEDDSSCVPNWRLCNGYPDCNDNSDEAECPPQVAALLQSPPNPVAKPYADIMHEVSGVQICIVAVALVLTLLLITCVINHYKQFGVRSWSSEQRRQKSKRSADPSVLYSPAKVEERMKKDTLLLQEHQLRMLSVQKDLELNLPIQVGRPPEEEFCWPGQLTADNVPKAYVKPPPNRTVTLKDRCVIPQIPSLQVHKQKTPVTTKDASERHALVKCPRKPHSSTVSTLDYVPERWQPPGGEMCVVELFDDSRDPQVDNQFDC